MPEGAARAEPPGLRSAARKTCSTAGCGGTAGAAASRSLASRASPRAAGTAGEFLTQQQPPRPATFETFAERRAQHEREAETTDLRGASAQHVRTSGRAIDVQQQGSQVAKTDCPATATRASAAMYGINGFISSEC